MIMKTNLGKIVKKLSRTYKIPETHTILLFTKANNKLYSSEKQITIEEIYSKEKIKESCVLVKDFLKKYRKNDEYLKREI